MDLHELKQRLQQHFSDGLLAVVGSGISCSEGIPGMQGLSKHLIEHVGPALVGDQKLLWDKIVPEMEVAGLESALLKFPPSPDLEAKIVIATAELIAAAEKIVISEVFAGTRVLRLTRLIPHLLKPSSGIPFVTTNYDRLIEVAVEEAGLGVDTMFVGRFAGRLDERESRLSFCREVSLKKSTVVYRYQLRALVYKPHGSLDWYLRNESPVQYAGDLPGAQRLIITPGSNKFRNGYESPFDHHRARANEAIDRSSRFLILGYGFNDDHLETHLSPAIRAGKPTLILARSLSQKAEETATKFKNVVSLDSQDQGGVPGTRAIVNGATTWFPGLSLWDVDSFITEVFDP